MARPIMTRETAAWLLQNTSLSAKQISVACNLHLLEVNALAKKDTPLKGENPFLSGQLTPEDVAYCEKNPDATLKLSDPLDAVPTKKRETKYTPMAARHDKPKGILWLIKNYPHLTNRDIGTLMASTVNTVLSIREGTHPLMPQLIPQNPLLTRLCTEENLEALLKKRAPKSLEPQSPPAEKN